MRRRTLATLIAAPPLLLSVVGCTTEAPEPSPTSQPSETSTPAMTERESASVPYEEPETVEGEVPRASFEVVDDVPTTTSTTVDAIAAGATIVVEGQCTGGESVAFELWRAEPGEDSGETLLSGEIDCDAPTEHNVSHSLPYEGVVQMMLTSTDSVSEAWGVARQE